MKRPLVTLLLLLSACGVDERWYSTEVDIVRISAVRRDDTGNALTTDVEVSYELCPGTQLEVIRGDKEFSACIARHKVGDRVPAKIRWSKGTRGYYESAIHALGECPRPPDPNDEASFTTVRDCEDWRIHDALVGFECKYLDKHDLNKVCPWFKRR